VNEWNDLKGRKDKKLLSKLAPQNCGFLIYFLRLFSFRNKLVLSIRSSFSPHDTFVPKVNPNISAKIFYTRKFAGFLTHDNKQRFFEALIFLQCVTLSLMYKIMSSIYHPSCNAGRPAKSSSGKYVRKLATKDPVNVEN
jgi:hypothetical protein